MQADLIERETPNYAGATFPPPRDFQTTAHEKLRAGARAGHRCQLLMAPTGAGKTYLGMQVGHEALLKGKTALFVCDRTTLINQTSAVADSYGLSAHGVIQADHWRTDRSAPFQICSLQTLARRSWPDADVIIIDEAHTQYKAWTDHIQTCRAAVIGLSATPFSAGLGKLFTNLVNASSMHALTESGVLVPMRDFHDNALLGIQTIRLVDNEWEKKMLPGMRAKGAVLRIGPQNAQEAFFCEGYATGLSIDLALRLLRLHACVVVCFSATNMTYVADSMTGKRHVFADNDVSLTGENQ